jgi:hypothetical protein
VEPPDTTYNTKARRVNLRVITVTVFVATHLTNSTLSSRASNWTMDGPPLRLWQYPEGIYSPLGPSFAWWYADLFRDLTEKTISPEVESLDMIDDVKAKV